MNYLENEGSYVLFHVSCMYYFMYHARTISCACFMYVLFHVKRIMSSHPISMSLSMTMKVEHKEEGVCDL